jgi:hypothetical protein
MCLICRDKRMPQGQGVRGCPQIVAADRLAAVLEIRAELGINRIDRRPSASTSTAPSTCSVRRIKLLERQGAPRQGR